MTTIYVDARQTKYDANFKCTKLLYAKVFELFVSFLCASFLNGTICYRSFKRYIYFSHLANLGSPLKCFLVTSVFVYCSKVGNGECVSLNPSDERENCSCDKRPHG